MLEQRRIVISAHSLGSVLAVAVILATRISDEDKSRLALLSYGSQLRAYFSRIFPELLGPKVLGTQYVDASSLRTPDPWKHEIDDHRSSFDDLPDTTLQPPFEERSALGRLTATGSPPRWRNLWRRSDYLGFPVVGYPRNAIDRIATEVVPIDYLAEIQTHGGYPLTPDYTREFDELVTELQRIATPETEEDRGPPS